MSVPFLEPSPIIKSAGLGTSDPPNTTGAMLWLCPEGVLGAGKAMHGHPGPQKTFAIQLEHSSIHVRNPAKERVKTYLQLQDMNLQLNSLDL